jgi:hypothetical protein
VTDPKKINATFVLIAYLALATPVQAFLWFLTGPRVKYASWILALNCSAYLQAIVILAVVVVLRSNFTSGDGAKIPEKQIRSRRLVVLVGAASGLVAALVWYYGFRAVSNYSGQRDYILGLRYFPGYLQLRGGVAHFWFFSVFVAVYLSIVASDLAWRSPPRLHFLTWTLSPSVTSAPAFVWSVWVDWLVLYRLSEWIYLAVELAFSHHVVSLADSYLSFLPLFATSITCVPVSYWLFSRAPQTRESSIGVSLTASFLIPILAVPLLLPSGFLAFSPLAFCIGTLNAAGFVWGWMAGDLRWRSMELQKSFAQLSTREMMMGRSGDK